MSSSLGLNEHHQSHVVNYMRFARYQRSQHLRGIDACFRDVKRSQLEENNYTVDEVEAILDDLQAEIRAEVENELLNSSHTNILLLRQMFQQAENWHLKLAADIGELENRELLEKIRDFEDREFSGTQRDNEFKPSLTPMNDSGGTQLLKMEISRLEKEIDKYRKNVFHLEEMTLNLNREKSLLMSELDKAIGRGAGAKVIQRAGGDTDVRELERQLNSMRADLEKNRTNSERGIGEIEQALADAKHELLKVRHTLELAERELEQKVSQTTPFKNLKQMLQRKNEQMKELRRRLSKYEEEDDD